MQAWNLAASRLFGWEGADVLGRPVSVAMTGRTPELDRCLCAALAGVHQRGTPVRALHRDGRTVPVDLWTAPLGAEAETSDLLCLFADRADPDSTEEDLGGRPGNRDSVQPAWPARAPGTGLAAPLQTLVSRLAELLDASLGVVFLWEQASERLVACAVHGPPNWVGDEPWSVKDGVSGFVAARREGAIVNAYPTSPHAHLGVLARTPINAALVEPLLGQDRLLGVVALADPRPVRAFTERDQGLLRLVAPQLILALDCARFAGAGQSSVRTLDRIRLAERLRALIEASFERAPSAPALAEHLGVPLAYALAVFRERFGLTPMQYLRQVRLR